jgi:hypothetical protein
MRRSRHNAAVWRRQWLRAALWSLCRPEGVVAVSGRLGAGAAVYGGDLSRIDNVKKVAASGVRGRRCLSQENQQRVGTPLNLSFGISLNFCK